MKLLTSTLIIFFSTFFYGQNMTINGNLKDTLNDQPKENAVIMLIRLSDSVLLDFKRTDKTGEFSFNLPLDTVEIIISHHKNDDKIIFFFPSETNDELNLTNTILPEKSEKLNEVTIYAYKDPIFFRGDTLVYTADSFKTKQNAVVEDLLKKLPGVEVDKNGSITSQGREVNKVLVDGDEFFGSDPTIATKNLGAKSIESVEIYEEENTESSETSEETIQVMDLKLKEDAKKGYFGRVSGASDFTNFYEGELLFSRFKNDFKLSIFALGSNTPRANFGYGDIRKFGIGNNNSDFFGDNEERWWYGGAGQNNSGIPRTLKSGIFYSDKLSEKIKVGLNYTYNTTDLDIESNQSIQYLLRDSTYFVDDSSNSTNNNEEHLVNAFVNYQMDSLTLIEILPRFSQSNSTNSLDQSNTFRNDTSFISSISRINQINETKNENFSTEFRLTRKFSKAKRLLKYSYKFTNSSGKNDQTTINNNSYFLPSYTDSTDQNLTYSTFSEKHQSQLLFREPITKKWGIDIEHLFIRNNSNQDRNTNELNVLNNIYELEVPEFSNEFNNLKITNRLGLFYSYKYKKDILKIGGYARNVKIDNFDENMNPLSINPVDRIDILPKLIYRHKFTNSQRLRFTYKTNSRQPSLNQLQPVQNNSNPNKITEGNPDLIPNYSHVFNLRYNHWKGISGSYIWSNAEYRINLNDFSNEVTYDNIGRTFSKTINVGQQDYGWIGFGGKISLGNSSFGIRSGNSFNYSETKNKINGLLNETTTYSASSDLSLEWDTDSIYIVLGAEYSYSKPINTLSFYNSRPFTTQSYFMDFDIELPWKMDFNCEANYTINSQRAAGYDISFLLIDLAISRRFLKTENLILSFEGNDILNQNVLAQRIVQNNMIIDNRTTIISRYFLLRLTYKFNNNKSKVKDASFH